MTDANEPTLAELGRMLDRIEREFGRRLDDMKEAFERTVAADVYEAHRQAMVAQIATAVAEAAEVRAETEKEFARLREEAGQQRAADQKRADRRLAIVSLVLTAVFSTLTIAVAVIAIIVQ